MNLMLSFFNGHSQVYCVYLEICFFHCYMYIYICKYIYLATAATSLDIFMILIVMCITCIILIL